MGQEQAGVSESERWRGKYFDTLSELEAKERDWRRVEELLRQSLARLTLVTDPADAPLKAAVERLREALRRGQPSGELEPLLSALAAEVARHTQQPHVQLSVSQLLAQIIDGIEFPKGVGHKARALRKRLESPSDDPALVSEAAQLLRDAIAWHAEAAAAAPAAPHAEADNARPGLLGRLLRRNGQAAEPPLPAEEPAPAPAPAPEAPADPLRLPRDLLELLIIDLLEGRPADRVVLEARLAPATTEEGLRALAVDLVTVLRDVRKPPAGAPAPASGGELPAHELLIQLLERLSVPDELHPRLEAIKAELAPGLAAPASPARAINAIVDLITVMRTRVEQEKADLERFLKQLTANLQELDSNMRIAAATHREAMQDGHALGEAVEAQMHGIESSMQAATDLDSLKSVLHERIETLQNHLESFRKSEEERTRLAEAEAKRLADRLAEMEREASLLRERVRSEHVQALIDPLTGVANRLAYNERLAQEYARWKRYRDPLVFSVWDVDNFKKINDTYGHQAGDKVLRVVAKLLSGQTRETDFLARYGGEEFVLLLPKTQLHQARHVAEKLRTAVQACEFHYKDKPVRITISCGMTEFKDNEDPETVFARADEALYAAKQAGRNRCVFKE